MVAQRQEAVALLALLLGAYSAAAYPMIWASMTKDCKAVPLAGYGPHSAPVQDDKTLLTVKKNGGAVAKICPGVVHKIKAVFPEQRQYLLTTTSGGFAGIESAECPQRSFSQVAKPDMEVDLTIPCDATGDVTLTLLSVGSRSGDRTYQSISTTMPVKDLKTCPASPCHSAAAQKAAAPGTLLMESAPLTGADPAQLLEIEKQIMALDPKLVKDGSVNVQELLLKLGLQQQAQQGGIAAPAPDAAAAQPEAPNRFQITDIFGPLKHLLPGQQQQQADKQDGGINPLKFLQTVANLMPQQQGAAEEGAAADAGQNPLKMLQNIAALVAAGSKDGGKDGSAAPIMNLLQTVGNAIQSGGDNATAQKDGLPILNMFQALGGMVGQGGKDAAGNPVKGMDPSAMLDVVKSLGALMPGENGGAPNMHSLMNFVNAVGKVIPGAAASNEPAPKDLPAAGIAVLKSLAAMMPKETAVGQPAGPNWPAMMQFVKASGNLIQLMRPPAGAAAAPHDE